MARLAAIVLILGVCQKENVLAREVLGAGEIDSSTVEIGAYVVVIYGQGERDPASGRWERMATAKGYVRTVDSDRLIIGDGSWKTEIARGRILKLIIAVSAREITSDTLSLRARYGPELTLEAGYFWGVSKAYTGYFIFGETKKRALPWSASLFFGHFLSGERRSRFGLRCAYRKVQIFPVSPELEHVSLFPPWAAELRRRVEGLTSRLVSIMLVSQHVLHSGKQVVVLADLAFGLSFESFYYISGGGPFGSRTTRPRGSAGAAIQVPVHPRIDVQATLRGDFFWEYLNNPFLSGISVAVGPLLKF